MSHSNLLELSTFPFHYFFQFLQFCFYVDKAISRYFLEELKRVKKTKIVKTAKKLFFIRAGQNNSDHTFMFKLFFTPPLVLLGVFLFGTFSFVSSGVDDLFSFHFDNQSKGVFFELLEGW